MHLAPPNETSKETHYLAASKFIIAVHEIAFEIKANARTRRVGKIDVAGLVLIMLSGKVVMGLEIRDLSTEKIEFLFCGNGTTSTTIAFLKTKIPRSVFERSSQNYVRPAFNR